MLRRIPFIILAAIGLLPLTCCNSSSEAEFVATEVYSNVIVKSFRLNANDSVLANLDSVYFAVDLSNARIYNPDSLPKGTRLNRILITPTYGDVSKAEITMRMDDGTDSTFTYSSANSDTINFENGPVKLTLTSLDEQTTLTYDIQINVHTVDPDLYSWNNFGQLDLGVDASKVAASAMISRGDSLMVAVTFTGATAPVVFTGSGNGLEKWTKKELTLPSGADVTSLCATDSRFFVIAGRKLYSADNLNTAQWTDCGVEFDNIYGAQAALVLGNVRNADGSYSHITYPATATLAVDADCPVQATSQMLTFTSKWSATPMSLVVGGRCADGSVTGATWAYDGSSWQRISVAAMPALENVSVTPYYAFRLSNQWIVSDESILLAMGGVNADDTRGSATYISYDRGIHWSEASDNMQLPSAVTPLGAAQAFTIDATLYADAPTASATSVWRNVAVNRLPAWFVTDSELPGSRAVKPITQWECPYIYLFDNANVRLWRGVVNRLTFKPLQ